MEESLDFGSVAGNPDLYPDRGIFFNEFYHCAVGFGSSPTTRRLADLGLNQSKAAWVEVCALESASVSVRYVTGSSVGAGSSGHG